MKRINVLITGIGGPTAQGVLRCLRDKKNIYLIGADRRSITSGNQFCDTVYQIPRYTDTDEYRASIKEIVKKEEVEVIFPALHEEIPVYKGLREELSAEIALPKSEVFDALLNKEKTYQYLQENGFRSFIPKYYGFTNTDELKEIVETSFLDEEYIVAKQVEGHGAMGFAILTNRTNYLNAVKNGRPRVLNIEDYYDIDYPERRMVMEYLGGKEYSVDIFLHNGKVITSIPRERTGVSNGIVLDGTVVHNEKLIEVSTEIAECLAYDGFINLQFITTEDGYKLTDVNPRFCGSQVMSLGAGVNFPYLFLQYKVLGEYERVNPRWNTRMLRYREARFIYSDE